MTPRGTLLDDLPKAQWRMGDRGYDTDWFRDPIQAKDIQLCITDRRSRCVTCNRGGPAFRLALTVCRLSQLKRRPSGVGFGQRNRHFRDKVGSGASGDRACRKVRAHAHLRAMASPISQTEKRPCANMCAKLIATTRNRVYIFAQ
ncbi:hypothetical protein GVO57_14165 (plasmid) [Sphingomonas changnyeongensis]|uniref:Transposase DDE domain-containing protein n=1 Tax=Sphingomonas changnyeongensis TaxID=2698679 RepID=A0A7Z2NZ22_9SPHN|nr:hypothetical protein GVO57_14165 [Sphingomonas changnyeongensis]